MGTKRDCRWRERRRRAKVRIFARAVHGSADGIWGFSIMRRTDYFRVLRGRRRLAAFGLVASTFAASAFAGSDREPVILGTQTGIHDGKSGVVLQNAPLSRQPMVPTERLPELAPQAQPPIVVSPYVQIPGTQAAPTAAYRPRPRASE